MNPRSHHLFIDAIDPHLPRVELEDIVREGLAQGEQFHGSTAKPGLVDTEALNGITDLCLRDGNRDRIFWVCDPLLDANIQQREGVRMAAFIRGHVRASQFAKVPSMCRYWLRTVWIRRRGSDEPWILLDNQVPNGQSPHCSETWIDAIVFHQPSPSPSIHECCSRGALDPEVEGCSGFV